MSAPKGHKVVTVERQGGYAARCTVVVDGVETLCGITFGGFDTRTEARAALAHEDAPATVGAARGCDPITTQQGSEQIMGILPDTEVVHQSLRAWAADYAAELRAHMAAAATSEHFAAFVRTFPDSTSKSPRLLEALWAEMQVEDVHSKAQALPIWPAWVENVDAGMMLGGVVTITVSGPEYGDDDGDVAARVSGVITVVVLPELANPGGDPATRAEVGDHDLGSSLEVGWDGPEPYDGSSAERIGAFGMALLQASAQLAGIEAGVL